jgi:hypothetical protein
MSDALIEQAASAHRERDGRGRLVSSSAWHDLDDAGRQAAFEAATMHRALEAAVDPDGLSATAHAVLRRIRRT